ncbi:hypothetical protein ACFLU1_07280, partial [Chloroflexota bacterium]
VEDSESGQTIGIEVKHLFYDPDEAKILLGRSTKPNHNQMNTTELITTLNKLLEVAAESAESYDFNEKIFIIIRVASPIFDKSTFDMFEEDIIIPPSVFNEIWLIFYDSSKHAWGNLKYLK